MTQESHSSSEEHEIEWLELENGNIIPRRLGSYGASEEEDGFIYTYDGLSPIGIYNTRDETVIKELYPKTMTYGLHDEHRFNNHREAMMKLVELTGEDEQKVMEAYDKKYYEKYEQ